MTLTLTPLRGIPLIRRDDNLADIILRALADEKIELAAGDILVVAQKIISKAEGRMIDLADVQPSPAARELASQTQKDAREVELVLQESNAVLRARPGTIIVEHKLGFVCANAGIDHSNVAERSAAQEYVLLLPRDPDRSATELRRQIGARLGASVGVMIIDSHGRAWRNGIAGACIGLSGVPALIDERGWTDLFGYTMRITVVAVADELAAAASLIMGQADEGTPVVHVRGFPYPLAEGSMRELLRSHEQDLFR